MSDRGRQAAIATPAAPTINGSTDAAAGYNPDKMSTAQAERVLSQAVGQV